MSDATGTPVVIRRFERPTACEVAALADLLIAGGAADPPEASIRYTLLGGRIGAATGCDYLRGVVDAAVWLGLAPLPARLLWRLGARRQAASTQRWWARGISRALGLRIEVAGLDRIDPCQTYVVAPLHEGFADCLALLRLPLRLRFVVRDELAGWPLLGSYLRDTGQIAVCPEEGVGAYRHLLRAAGSVFAAGDSLVVLPQGGILGIETEFFRGAFALARAHDRPLLPIALTGGHRVWEHPFGPRLRRGERLSLRVLPPVSAAELRDRGVEAVRRDIQQRLKAEALDGTMAPPRRFVPARDGYWDGYAYAIDPTFAALAAEIAARRVTPGGATAEPKDATAAPATGAERPGDDP